MPFFSVIIPIYNAQRYLQRCIESIQRQSFNEYEVIFVDDASVDLSPKICAAICKKDVRFNYYSKNHEGASAARNYGILQSKGDYIVFVDADDYIAEQMLQKLFEIISCGELPDVCFMSCHYVDKGDRCEKNIIFQMPEKIDKRKVFRGEEFLELVTMGVNHMPGSTWLMVFRNKFLDQEHLKFDQSLVWSEDSDLAYRAFICTNKIKCCEFCGYYYNVINGDSVSKKITLDKAMDRMNVYSKWIIYFLNDSEAKEKYSTKAREKLIQQFLDEYCSFLNLWTEIEDKKQRICVYSRLKKERYLWKRSKNYKYRDYIRFGILGGTMLQKIKRQIKKNLKGFQE